MNAGVLSVFSLPGHELLGARLLRALDAADGRLVAHEFPDGETYVRVDTPCDGGDAILAVNLFRPNPTIVPLLFAAQAIKERGARQVILASPYLPYMRQDKRFHRGEVVSAELFASLLCRSVDGLVTVDPHLHRIRSLAQIYSIPHRAEHATRLIAEWIVANVERPLIVGPDSESAQWVEAVAGLADAPRIVLTKTRRGDRDVEVSAPPSERWKSHVPVLVDDIISTARTMIETVRHLVAVGYAPPVCVGVHALFDDAAYRELLEAGAARVVTGNSVAHESNAIDLTPLLADGVRGLLTRT